MKKLITLALLASSGIAAAQSGYFVDSKGASEPVIIGPGYSWSLGYRTSLDLGPMLSPIDKVQVGAALTFQFPLGTPRDPGGNQVEFGGFIGIGSMFGDSWQNIIRQARPGVTFGLTVKF